MKKGVLLGFFLVLFVSMSYASVPDADFDGVPDESDNCQNSHTTEVDQFGCDCIQKGCIPDKNPCTDDCGVINALAACNVPNNNQCQGGYCQAGKCVGHLKCGVDSFSVWNECASGYRQAKWRCYDGLEYYQATSSSCKPYETWKKYATEDCEGRCTTFSEPIKNITEKVTCVFMNSKTFQRCYSNDNSNIKCAGVEYCTTEFSGFPGSKIDWLSSCKGFATTIVDGKGEKISFECAKDKSLIFYVKPTTIVPGNKVVAGVADAVPNSGIFLYLTDKSTGELVYSNFFLGSADPKGYWNQEYDSTFWEPRSYTANVEVAGFLSNKADFIVTKPSKVEGVQVSINPFTAVRPSTSCSGCVYDGVCYSTGTSACVSGRLLECESDNGGSLQDTLLEKQTKTYSIRGIDYDVTLNFVDSNEAQLVINGQTTRKMRIGETDTLADGSKIGVTDILFQTSPGGINSVTFFIRANNVKDLGPCPNIDPYLSIIPATLIPGNIVQVYVTLATPNSQVNLNVVDFNGTVFYDSYPFGYTDSSGNFSLIIYDTSQWTQNNYRITVNVNNRTSNEVLFTVIASNVTLARGLPSTSGGYLINQSPKIPNAEIKILPEIVTQGQSATLFWNTLHATSVWIDNGIGNVSASGSISGIPSQTTTYTLTASNSAGSTTKSATVKVIPLELNPILNLNPARIKPGESFHMIVSQVTSGSVVYLTAIDFNDKVYYENYKIGTADKDGTLVVQVGDTSKWKKNSYSVFVTVNNLTSNKIRFDVEEEKYSTDPDSKTLPQCGDGIVEGIEECDDGDKNGDCPSSCSKSCRKNSCTGPSECSGCDYDGKCYAIGHRECVNEIEYTCAGFNDIRKTGCCGCFYDSRCYAIGATECVYNILYQCSGREYIKPIGSC